MNRTEAMLEMHKGKSLTHPLFHPGEWVTVNSNGDVVDEQGYIIDFVEFWKNRQSRAFATDWEYFKETPSEKQRFFQKMDSPEVYFPRNEQELDWFEEWLDAHPELNEEAEQALREINDQQAAEYMVMKIMARVFIEKQGAGMVSAKLEPRKITIYGPGKSNENTFEINL